VDDIKTTPEMPAMDQPVDEVRLQEFDQVLRKYKAGKAHLERRVVQSEQWWKLRNDAAARREYDVGWDKDFSSRSGWLHNVLVSKHADAMENYPEAMILPREPNDKSQAQMLSAIIPCILEQTEFETTYSNGWWRKLKTGTAVYKCSWDADALNGLGEISVQDIDLLSVFWEPGVRDIQDSRYFFHVELHDNDLLEKQYPELQDKLKGNTLTLTKFIYDDYVPTDGKSIVVDVYYKQDGRLHYCKYCGDTILYSTENKMEDGLYNDGLYPFVFDPLFPIEGSPCGYGYVDLCKNSQTAIDIMRTAFIKNAKVTATPRYFARSDGSVNETELLDTTKALVHVSGSLDEDFLRAIQTPGLPNLSMSFYDTMIQELRETSGNTESANGIYSGGVTAASSIAALQEASGKTSRDASRSSYRAFRKLVTMIIERIRQFYDNPRQFRITGQFGQEEFVAFDNSGIAPQMTGIGDTQIGFTQPVFDIRVEVQKRNAYTRTSQNELALQLYQLGVFAPGNEGQALMLTDMMDFDGKEDLQQKLQQRQMMMAMMPPPVPEEEPKTDSKATHLKNSEEEPTFLQKARARAQGASSV
jgi:hypothetical protein